MKRQTKPLTRPNGERSATEEPLRDSYSRHTDTIMEDCPSTTSGRDFEKIVDNIITHSDMVEGAFERICSIKSYCNKNGLVFMITDDGIKPAAKYTTSFRDFPTLTTSRK